MNDILLTLDSKYKYKYKKHDNFLYDIKNYSEIKKCRETSLIDDYKNYKECINEDNQNKLTEMNSQKSLNITTKGFKDINNFLKDNYDYMFFDEFTKKNKITKRKIIKKNKDKNTNVKFDRVITKNKNNSEYRVKYKAFRNMKKDYAENTKNTNVKIIDDKIESIDDILNILDKYDVRENYNINIKSLNKIKEPLRELNNMIGLDNLKKSILYQIMYFIQGFHKKDEENYMHICLYGNPGTGKTDVAKIMGTIFSRLGLLKKNTFRKVTRPDLIAGYLGQTAIKTKKVIEEALDGVLFIDEAYSLGNRELRDSFSKECIDTLCESLSDYKDRLLVIIAGYEKELDKCFFSYNKGLSSRFPWRYNIDKYKEEELTSIFKLKVKKNKWKLHEDITDEILISWFKENYDFFEFMGRDVVNFISKIKISHSFRVFSLPENDKFIITMEDITTGFDVYKKNNKYDVEKEDKFYLQLYT